MSDDKLRAEFEAWAHNKLTLDGAGGAYRNFSTQAAWETYKAAHASGVKAGLERAREICKELPRITYEVKDDLGQTVSWITDPDDCANAIQQEIKKL